MLRRRLWTDSVIFLPLPQETCPPSASSSCCSLWCRRRPIAGVHVPLLRCSRASTSSRWAQFKETIVNAVVWTAQSWWSWCLSVCVDSISAGGMRSPSSPRPSREESASRPTTLWGKTAAFRCSTLSSSEYFLHTSDGECLIKQRDDWRTVRRRLTWVTELVCPADFSHEFAEFRTCFRPSVKTKWGPQRGRRWFTTREKPPNWESASRIVSSSSLSSYFGLFVIFIVFFFSPVFYFPLCDLCSQLLPTARTGSWPPTTPACPSCTLARTSSACSTSSSPGSSGGLASCRQRPWVTPKSCWWTKESTCPGWRTQIRRAARTTRDPRRLVNRHRGRAESSSLTMFHC